MPHVDKDKWENQIVYFEHGIPGFEQLKSYVMIPEEDGNIFAHLQSVDEESVAFLLANPFYFFRDYEFQLTKQVQKELELKDENDVEVWTIITVGDKLEDSTTNLLAPLIVNSRLKLGKQIILQDTSYQTKHRLLKTSAEPSRLKE